MKQQYNRHIAQTPQFLVGDLVWLDASNIHLTGTRKLSPKRLGPYKIIEQINELAYKLQLPESMHIHPVFHASLLYPAPKDTIEGRIPTQPEPIEVEREEEYEVEKILNIKKKECRLLYLVKWKGYPRSEATWEPASHLSHASRILEEYKKKNNVTNLPAPTN